MSKMLMLFGALFLTGCSGQNIVTTPSNTKQINDLRDLDGDGIIEAREQCADTVFGALVNNHGCSKVKEISKRIQLNVLFSNGSSVVLPQYYNSIKELADFMNKYPEAQVVIEGHSSAVGSADRNMRLSQSRAQAIANLLTTEHGIDKQRITAKGFGETQLLDTADTPVAHAKNRRVVADISGTDKTTNFKWTIYSVDQ